MARRINALVTIGSNGGVSYQHIANDDVFALVRDNEPELTQLFAEGRFGTSMFTRDGDALIDDGASERESQQWLASGPSRRNRRKRPRKRV